VKTNQILPRNKIVWMTVS